MMIKRDESYFYFFFPLNISGGEKKRAKLVISNNYFKICDKECD